MIYFTSDLHFQHLNAIKNNKRPFKNLIEMNNTLISNWNKKVSPTDTVYVLGDFVWNNKVEDLTYFLKNLNGIKTLIMGNHDSYKNNKLCGLWKDIFYYNVLRIDKRRVVVSHYPIADWEGANSKSIHLYGHCHGRFDLASLSNQIGHKNTRCMDVGVDANNYFPVSWEDIIKKFPK